MVVRVFSLIFVWQIICTPPSTLTLSLPHSLRSCWPFHFDYFKEFFFLRAILSLSNFRSPPFFLSRSVRTNKSIWIYIFIELYIRYNSFSFRFSLGSCNTSNTQALNKLINNKLIELNYDVNNHSHIEKQKKVKWKYQQRLK